MNEPVPLLATTGIAKSYGPVVALQSVDLAVRQGEVHALLGANGAGKSTLVKILAGVHAADQGTVQVEGQPMRFQAPVDAMTAGIATVFQDPALIPDLTVTQNLRLSDLDRTEFRRWLAWFELGHLDLAALVRELPLETLRMVDLARALARDPQVLLLDEITAALTADQADQVFALLAQWKEKGRSAVLITHRLAEVMRICDRATILRDGRDVALLETARIDEGQLVDAMLGTSHQPKGKGAQRDRHRAAAAPDAEAVFAVKDLGSGDVVRNVSFAVHRGEILGLVALEGQGQERMFGLLSGERRPTSGEIAVHGSRCRFFSPYDAVQKGVVLIPGNRLLALLPNLSVRQNLVVPLFNRLRQWLHIPADEPQRARNAIDRLSIDTRAAAQVRRLSGGNQQKVAIGRWLVAGFQTLLCFDPTRGIDIRTKQEIYVLLRELAANGAAILLYTSELSEIPLVCDRVLVMHDGRIVDEQDAARATEASMLTAAHGLLP